jgi:hypothetical protein
MDVSRGKGLVTNETASGLMLCATGKLASSRHTYVALRHRVQLACDAVGIGRALPHPAPSFSVARSNADDASHCLQFRRHVRLNLSVVSLLGKLKMPSAIRKKKDDLGAGLRVSKNNIAAHPAGDPKYGELSQAERAFTLASTFLSGVLA